MSGSAPHSATPDDLPPARRLGYRLLGPAFDYLLHLRPAEWPIMLAHTGLGYLLAAGTAGAGGTPRGLDQFLIGLALWVVCLNGGTLAINSAFDEDEGDVAYLRRPPKPPRGLFTFGMALMLGGLLAAIALDLDSRYRLAYAICLIMSVAYSVPPMRLKAVAGADWVINIVGFGALTPLAGWTLSGRALTPDFVWIVLAFGALFGSLYPLTQLYQMEEDRARGDRTLALRLGLETSLTVALLAAALAFAAFTRAGLLAAWTTDVTLRWAGLAVSALAWAAVLVPWRARAARLAPAAHQRGMHLALGAWAVTDVGVAVAWLM